MTSSSPASRRSSTGPLESPSKYQESNNGVPANRADDRRSLAFAKRLDIGTRGSKTTALTNYFQTNIDNLPDLHEYSFKITKDVGQVNSREKRRTISLLLDGNYHSNFRFAASDYGGMFFSTKPLTPLDTRAHTYLVNYFEEEETGPRSGDAQVLIRVTVTSLQQYRTLDLQKHQKNSHEPYALADRHIAALNILLGRGPAQNPGMVTNARREKFFDITPNNGRGDLGRGLDAYKGYFRSARLTISGLLINLNVATSAFYQTVPLDRLIGMIMVGRDSYDIRDNLKYLDSQLAYLRIETTYLGRKSRKTIRNVARANNKTVPPTSANITFKKDGISTSIQAYFAKTYPHIHRPNLNALVVNVGSKSKPVYLPSDLCTVLSGQVYRKLLPQTSQTANMIRYACRRPAQNMELILREGLPQMGVGVPGGPFDRFGIKIRDQMLTINARILPQPSLTYATGADSNIGKGSWNMAKKKFKVPAPRSMMMFSVIEILPPNRQSTPNRSSFITRMREAIRLYTGHSDTQIMTFNDFEHSFCITPNGNEEILTAKWQWLLAKGIKLLFVILPSKSVETYTMLKTSADTLCAGIHTVCVVRDETTGRVKEDDGTLANLMLKVNQKLGGVNLRLNVPPVLKKILGKRVMFIGADVIHPGKNAMKDAPSVAAVVASVDEYYFQYPGTYRLQHNNDSTKQAVEFIKDFGDMCEERLRLYYDRNDKNLPDVIVVYRDGVAENMFSEVLNTEMLQLQRVYKKAYTNRKPPNTIFIVVTKRGNTRFYQPKSGSSSAFDKQGNPLPGFVVDTQITNTKVWDWFLVSHKCIQGTSRPAHYTVLHDDIGATSDELQYLTHSMCFLWGRATKSISVHPAARAADTMCFRAKFYLDPVYNPLPYDPDEEKPVYKATDGHWPGHIAGNLKNTMFYV